MLWVFLSVIVGLVVIGLLIMRRKPNRSGDVVSIVVLRQTPRVLTEADVRGMLRRAGAPAAELMPLPPIAPEMSGFAVLHDGSAMFYFISAARPYCDNPEQEALKFEDPRGRKAFAEHRAWVSIDAVGGMPPTNVREKVLGLMAKIAAELMDHESTLLYATWMNRVALPGPEAESALRSGTPLSVFKGDDELNAPIIHTEKGDDALERAIAEAKQNYPTLLSEWERMGEKCNAMVKGKFEHGERTEFMWIQVAAISDDGVTGELGNAPAHIPGLRKGQSVTVPHDRIVDWACVVDKKMQGMYVEKVLMQKSKRK